MVLRGFGCKALGTRVWGSVFLKLRFGFRVWEPSSLGMSPVWPGVRKNEPVGLK